MKKNIFITFFILVFVGVCTVAFLNAQKPRTYEDCIFKHVKKSENQRAASIIAATCRKQFPKDPVSLSEKDFLTDEEFFQTASD